MNKIAELLKLIPQPIIEAVKEAFRLALLLFVSLIVTSILNYVMTLPETQTTLVITFLLRALDKWLHEQGKQTDNKLMAGGLTRI